MVSDKDQVILDRRGQRYLRSRMAGVVRRLRSKHQWNP